MHPAAGPVRPLPLPCSPPCPRCLYRRHELYEGYKGQREACPTEVKEAIPRLQQLLRSMAIPYIQVSAASPPVPRLHAAQQPPAPSGQHRGGHTRAASRRRLRELCLTCGAAARRSPEWRRTT